MEKDGIIIWQIELIEWVNSFVIVIKFNGLVRFCFDFRDFNKVIRRFYYFMFIIEEIVICMLNVKYFFKLDVIFGFWQIQLDEDSFKFCIFNLLFGRFRFLRMLFGLNCVLEIY